MKSARERYGLNIKLPPYILKKIEDMERQNVSLEISQSKMAAYTALLTSSPIMWCINPAHLHQSVSSPIILLRMGQQILMIFIQKALKPSLTFSITYLSLEAMKWG